MGPCLSMASLSRLTSSISLVYRLEEKVRPWVWAARSSFTRCCKATSPGSSGTATVSSLQLLYWPEWDNCNANNGRHHLFFHNPPLDVLLSPSKWQHMHWSGDKATLTLSHLNKEDEGLYTLRVTTKSGYETYSAYVFVRGVIMLTLQISNQHCVLWK